MLPLDSVRFEHPDPILVAVIDGQVIGSVYTIEDPWSGFIYRLAVQTAYRKQGIGSVLLTKAERFKESAIFLGLLHVNTP